MSTSVRITSLALALAAAVLAGCAANPIRGAEEPAPPRDDDSARACLVDHSPWSLDIGMLLDEQVAFLAATAPDGAPSGWSAEGTATMTFTDESDIWQFVADGVAYTIEVPGDEGPVVVRSLQAEEQNGEYAVVPGGFFTVSAPASLTHVDQTTTTFPNGDVAEIATSIGTPPVFPWSRDIATGQASVTYAFACAPTELVITTSAPYGWHFVPGR